MAVRLAGEQVLQSAMAVVYCVAADQTRLGPDRPGRWTPCTCSLRMLQSQHTPLHTTDSPPLQNNQSKSLSDNWSVHCWGDGRESHSLDLVPLCSSDRRRSPHQLPSHPEEARREGGREGGGSHLLQYCGRLLSRRSRLSRDFPVPPTLSRSKLRQKC